MRSSTASTRSFNAAIGSTKAKRMRESVWSLMTVSVAAVVAGENQSILAVGLGLADIRISCRIGLDRVDDADDVSLA